MHDLPTLVLHLHFLAGIALELLAANLGNQVIGNLVGEDLGLIGLAQAQSLHLVLQLNGAAGAGAGHRLVGGSGHGLNGGNLVQGIDGGDGDDGRAVGVGNNALVPLHILRIDFRHNQRHVGIQPEGGGIVHKDRTGLHDGRSELLGNVVFRRAQHDVHALKGGITGLLNGHVFALELHGLAGGTGRGQGHQLPHRKVPLGQDFHHFLSHGAGCAQDGYGILFHIPFPPVTW